MVLKANIEGIDETPMFSLTWAGHNVLETLRQGKKPA